MTFSAHKVTACLLRDPTLIDMKNKKNCAYFIQSRGIVDNNLQV